MYCYRLVYKIRPFASLLVFLWAGLIPTLVLCFKFSLFPNLREDLPKEKREKGEEEESPRKLR